MYSFEDVNINDLDKEEYNNFEDKLIFTTLEWVEFLINTQNVKPIFIRIKKNNTYIGYFTCCLFKRFGFKIIGSPFKGWTTLYMGFDLLNDYKDERVNIIQPLWTFLKKKYRCIYMEIVDRKITIEEAKKAKLDFEITKSYEMRIDKSNEELLSTFTKSCRKQIGQFERRGATLKFVNPDEEFIKTYYKQLTDVFKAQGLVPTYDVNRVRQLINCLSKLDNSIICIQAYNDQGKCISSSLGFGYKKNCYAWGSASDKLYNFNQGKYMRWAAIIHWRDKGMTFYDLAGQRDYKKEFNPYEITVPRIFLYKNKIFLFLRNIAQKIYWIINKIKGNLKKHKRS